MESRTLLSAAITGSPSIVNVSKLVGPQESPTIVVNPTNPLDMFLIGNNQADTLYTATSTDGGHTWTTKVQFTGNDGFPAADFNATAAYDSYGNLFIAYRRLDLGSIVVLYSYDAGQTLHLLTSLPGVQSTPILATGHGTVWLGVEQSKQAGNPSAVANSGAVTYAAKVTGLGRIGTLKKVANVSTVNSDIESLAVGPGGQIAVAYQFTTSSGPSTIYTRTDPDGLGPQPFGAENFQVTTQVGTTELIPAQPNDGISAGASLAYDLSSDPYTGRLYLAYVSAPDPFSFNTNIFLRYSDNDGTTWSAPVKVNDDSSANSHFMPQLAVDPITGSVAVTWYDARNDNGIPGQGGTNNTANDDVQLYAAVGSPTATGVSFAPNSVIQPAYSNASDIISPTGATIPADFGLHNGLAFYNGQLIPTWTDNSNSTGNNADGALGQPEIYSAVVSVQTTPAIAATTLVGSFGPGAGALTYTAADGTKSTYQLSSGHGYLFVDGSGNLKLRVSGTNTSSVLTITAHRGSGRVTLSDVSINGSLGSLNAAAVDVTGNFAISGQVNHVLLGNINGGTFATGGAIGRMTVASLNNARVLSGAQPGPDEVFAGAGDTDDSFAAGSILSLTVKGSITTSFVGAGVSPGGGVFGSSNDAILGGTSSKIGTLIAGSADPASKFEAGAFGVVKLPQVINPATDPRFLVD
jgi:hypothetical protein